MDDEWEGSRAEDERTPREEDRVRTAWEGRGRIEDRVVQMMSSRMELLQRSTAMAGEGWSGDCRRVGGGGGGAGRGRRRWRRRRDCGRMKKGRRSKRRQDDRDRRRGGGGGAAGGGRRRRRTRRRISGKRWGGGGGRSYCWRGKMKRYAPLDKGGRRRMKQNMVWSSCLRRGMNLLWKKTLIAEKDGFPLKKREEKHYKFLVFNCFFPLWWQQ